MSTLTDRYVHAATRWLPTRAREPFALELRERIADTIEARGGGPTAERDTLVELGDPLRVAAEYHDRPTWLIGPRYYFAWLRLLLVLLAIVPAVLAIVGVVGAADDGLGAMIGAAVSGALNGAVHVAFWTTLVFAILEWQGVDTGLGEEWTIDSLPDPGDSTGDRSLGNLIASLVFLGLLVSALVWQRTSSPFVEDGDRIPLLAPDLWWPWIVLWIGALAVEALQAVWIHRAGHSVGTASLNTALNLVTGGSLAWLLHEDRVLNPALVDHLGWSADAVEQGTTIAAIVVVVIAVWDVAEEWIKALRAR